MPFSLTRKVPKRFITVPKLIAGGGGESFAQWPNLGGAGYFTTDALGAELVSARSGSEAFGNVTFFQRGTGAGTATLCGIGRSGSANGFMQHYAANPLMQQTMVRNNAGTNVHIDLAWGNHADGVPEWTAVEHAISAGTRTVKMQQQSGDLGSSVDTYLNTDLATDYDRVAWGAIVRNTVTNIMNGYMLGGLWYRGAVISAGSYTSIRTIFSSGASLKSKVEDALAVLEADLGAAVKFSQCFARNTSARVGTAAVEAGTITWDIL